MYIRAPIPFCWQSQQNGPIRLQRQAQSEKFWVVTNGKFTVVTNSRTLGVSEQSYYRWRKEYGGLRTDQAKRLKDLEKENGRLRKAISDLTLDKLILKEAFEVNC